MKTGTIVLLAVIAVVIIAAGAFLLNTNGGDSGTGNMINNQPEDNSPTPNPTPTTPQTYNVEIRNFAYSPATLTIKTGDTIIWTNKDSVRHTATSDSGSELDSELLSTGESYEHTFNTQGVYNYHCTPHPYMKAKIIVQ